MMIVTVTIVITTTTIIVINMTTTIINIINNIRRTGREAIEADYTSSSEERRGFVDTRS